MYFVGVMKLRYTVFASKHFQFIAKSDKAAYYDLDSRD